jgi:hypothetical protein
VADAIEAARQDMDEEAADERVPAPELEALVVGAPFAATWFCQPQARRLTSVREHRDIQQEPT